MMSYFDHPYASNSNIKEIVDRYENRQKPQGIQAIFDFGTQFHAGITEPHKADWSKVDAEDKELIQEMSKTFWRDPLCRQIAMLADFRREHEFYRVGRFGLMGAKCKTDGDSRRLQTILELKGLSVNTDKAFRESVEHLGYDQGGAWYLNTTDGYVHYKRKLIVGISKLNPDRLFKVIIDRDHPLYKTGMEKIKKGVGIWKMFGLK